MAIKTIIVDDERLERALIRNSVNFAGLGFALVGEAWDADSALELVQKLSVDLMLSDINLPYTNGIELAKQVKALNAAIDIIMITGYGTLPVALDAINNIGVHSFLLKPLNKAELTASLMKYKEKFDKEHQAGPAIAYNNPLAEKAITYIRTNYRDPDISLAKVAKELFVSEGYLSRIIQKGTGQKFTAYLIELRLAEAARLINERQFSTADAAARAGFKDVNYFYRCYKRYTGRTIKKSIDNMD